MKALISIFIFFLFLTFATFAQDLGNLYQLSQQGRDIVLKLPVAQGLTSGKFELNSQESSLVQNVSDIDQNLSDYVKATDPSNPYNLPSLGCDEGITSARKKVKDQLDRSDYQSFQTQLVGDPTGFERNSMLRIEMNRDGYLEFVERQKRNNNFRVESIATLSDLKNMFKKKNSTIDLEKMNPAEQERVLTPFIRDYLGVAPLKGVLTQSIIFDSTVAGSGDIERLLGNSKDDLTLEQKVAIVSRMGARAMYFSQNDEAKKKVDTGMGVVGDLAQVHDSFKYKKGKETIKSIGLAQSKWLKALGLEDPYVVGFRAAMGDEAATVAFDPKEKKFAVIGAPQDKAKMTSVFDSSGKLIRNIDRRLLKIFQDVGRGGNTDTLLNNKYAVQKMGYSGETSSGHLFMGTTMDGEALYGASVNKKLSSKYYSLETGGGIGRSPLDEAQGVIQSRSQIYGRIAQEIHTKEYDLDGHKIQGFVINENEFLNTNMENSATASSPQVRGVVQSGIKGTSELNNGATKIQAKVVYDAYPAWDMIDKKEVNREVASVNVNVKHRVSDDTKVLIDSAIMVRNYSTAIANDFGFTDEKRNIQMTIGTETVINRKPDIPASIQENENNKMRVRFQKTDVKRNLTFSIDFIRQGNDNQIYLQGEMKF